MADKTNSNLTNSDYLAAIAESYGGQTDGEARPTNGDYLRAIAESLGASDAGKAHLTNGDYLRLIADSLDGQQPSGGGGGSLDELVAGTITEAALSTISSTRSYAFANCSSLSTVELPNCTFIGDGAFQDCTALASVDFAKCSYLGNNALSGCTALTSVSLPACAYIGNGAFANCTALASVSLSNCTYIGGSVFSQCYNLTRLDLTALTSVPILGGSVFYSTPIGGYTASAGQTGTIFVPASLANAFRAASNWSSVSSRIVGL